MGCHNLAGGCRSRRGLISCLCELELWDALVVVVRRFVQLQDRNSVYRTVLVRHRTLNWPSELESEQTGKH
jgi:hypothetical protein